MDPVKNEILDILLKNMKCSSENTDNAYILVTDLINRLKDLDCKGESKSGISLPPMSTDKKPLGILSFNDKLESSNDSSSSPKPPMGGPPGLPKPPMGDPLDLPKPPMGGPLDLPKPPMGGPPGLPKPPMGGPPGSPKPPMGGTPDLPKPPMGGPPGGSLTSTGTNNLAGDKEDGNKEDSSGSDSSGSSTISVNKPQEGKSPADELSDILSDATSDKSETPPAGNPMKGGGPSGLFSRMFDDDPTHRDAKGKIIYANKSIKKKKGPKKTKGKGKTIGKGKESQYTGLFSRMGGEEDQYSGIYNRMNYDPTHRDLKGKIIYAKKSIKKGIKSATKAKSAKKALSRKRTQKKSHKRRVNAARNKKRRPRTIKRRVKFGGGVSDFSNAFALYLNMCSFLNYPQKNNLGSMVLFRQDTSPQDGEIEQVFQQYGYIDMIHRYKKERTKVINYFIDFIIRNITGEKMGNYNGDDQELKKFVESSAYLIAILTRILFAISVRQMDNAMKNKNKRVIELIREKYKLLPKREGFFKDRGAKLRFQVGTFGVRRMEDKKVPFGLVITGYAHLTIEALVILALNLLGFEGGKGTEVEKMKPEYMDPNWYKKCNEIFKIVLFMFVSQGEGEKEFNDALFNYVTDDGKLGVKNTTQIQVEKYDVSSRYKIKLGKNPDTQGQSPAAPNTTPTATGGQPPVSDTAPGAPPTGPRSLDDDGSTAI